MVAANEEGADHAKALAVELAEMLAVLVGLWGRAIESPAASLPPSRLSMFGIDLLNLPAGSTGSDDGELNAFGPRRQTSRGSRSRALARGGDVVDGDTVEITWGAAHRRARVQLARGATDERRQPPGLWKLPSGSSPLREGNRLGQILWPLVPMLCRAPRPRANGGARSVLALSSCALRRFDVDARAARRRWAATAPLPAPLEPPRPPVGPSRAKQQDGLLGSGVDHVAREDADDGSAPVPRAQRDHREGKTCSGQTSDPRLAPRGPREGVFGGVEPAALRLCWCSGGPRKVRNPSTGSVLIGQLTKLCKSLSGSTYHPAPAHINCRRVAVAAGRVFAPDEADELAEEHPAWIPRRCTASRYASRHPRRDAVGSKPEVHEGLVAMAVELADRFAAALAPAELTVAALAKAEGRPPRCSTPSRRRRTGRGS